MPIERYRHKKSGIMVESRDGGVYYQHTTNPNMKIPSVVVNGSTEWEEVVPIVDFYGNEVDLDKQYYRVILRVDDVPTVINYLAPLHSAEKTLSVFKEYEDACKYQRVFCALKKLGGDIITTAGNPSQYLKKILLEIHNLNH